MQAVTPPAAQQRLLLALPPDASTNAALQALAAAGITTLPCTSVAALAVHLAEHQTAGAAAVLLHEALLDDNDLPCLLAVLDQQPAWSDLPLLLIGTGDAPGQRWQQAAPTRPVLLLDPGVSPAALVSAVQAAWRGRQAQYRLRDEMAGPPRVAEPVPLPEPHKDEFLATLAHQLRNPLAPIKTGLQLIRRLPDSDPGRYRLFQMMDRQMAQLVKLIDDLLDVSRIATGKVVLQRETVDMRAVVEMAVEASQPDIDAAGHTLQLRWPAHPVSVEGDAPRLAQAIGNLLNNAAKYTPNGGVVQLTLAEQDGQALVTVSDNGMGIPPALLGRVFELFTQVDRTLDRAQGGLGIGLALVHKLTQLHGGSVQAHSDGIDRGSRFELRLPAARAASRRDPAERSATPQRPDTRPALRVLVVDDNVDAADTLAMMLRLSGHSTRVEYNAVSALVAAGQFLPEVVFCDLAMPRIDGHEFAARLRRDPRFAATLLIALTGWGGEDDQRRSLESGFDLHLVKPVAPETIDAALARR